MSSGKIRSEKECLNCGHPVEYLFCSKCGQKNVVGFAVVDVIGHHFPSSVLSLV